MRTDTPRRSQNCRANGVRANATALRIMAPTKAPVCPNCDTVLARSMRAGIDAKLMTAIANPIDVAVKPTFER
jgi:hypothetical protein